ncbi:MAG: metal-dependent transcriptional regulator [Gemmatimonadota bacterium]
MTQPPRLTENVEDYLKAIYELERAGTPAATTDLAAHLGVAPASVTGMVRRLAEQGLLTHERYHGVRLTEQGRRSALRTLRRHRVIESYLVQALGYGWDEVHDEAERLEHAASDDLIDRMARAIGEPSVDPHGAPIPSREGAVEEASYVALADLPVGARASIMRVADEDQDLLRHVAELMLTPGSTVRVVQRAPFGGPIALETEGRPVVIGPDLAARLLVDASRD